MAMVQYIRDYEAQILKVFIFIQEYENVYILEYMTAYI